MTRDQLAQTRRQLGAGQVGLIGLLVFVVLVIYAFGWRPWRSGYKVRVSAPSTFLVRVDDPVRVAGLDVGKVESVEGDGTANPTIGLRITDNSFVIREDARLRVRPRMFFEGAYYLDLNPGTPASPSLGKNTLVASQVSGPVQADQLNSALPKDIRDRAAEMLEQSKIAFSDGDPSGTQSLRHIYRELSQSLPSLRRTAQALNGERSGDSGRSIKASAKLLTQLSNSSNSLASLIDSNATVTAAVSRQSASLGQAIDSADQLFSDSAGNIQSLRSRLDTVASGVSEILPTIKEFASSAQSITDFLRKTHGLTNSRELDSVLTSARNILSVAPQFVNRTRLAQPFLLGVTECQNTQVLPVTKMVVPDGNLTTGQPAWLETLHLATNGASSASGFDGNGTSNRTAIVLGEQMFEGVVPGIGRVITTGAGNKLGSSPDAAGVLTEVPFRPDQVCSQQKLPDLSKNTDGAGLFSGQTTDVTDDLRRSYRQVPDVISQLKEAGAQEGRGSQMGALEQLAKTFAIDLSKANR